MPHKPYKHKLLLDEGLYPRNVLQRTNNRQNLMHIKHDLNKGGIPDKEVYEVACKQKRIVVTYNIDDFRVLAKLNKESGVIGVTDNLSPNQLDTKLSSLLNKNPEKSFYGKHTPLSHNE